MGEIERASRTSVMQVPPSLQAVGVQVHEDPNTGYRAVVIPPAIRDKVNVLMPITSFAQSDPNFTPSVRLVQLDPEVHAYKQGKKLAPSKQGLEVLAQCAGILYSRAERIPRADLHEGQRYGYRGIIGVRRSDGTVEESSREYAWNEEAERLEIEEAVRKSAREHPDWAQWQVNGRKATPEQLAELIDAEIRKRWIKELKDGSAKAESKAILRAIRAALQVPHTYTPQDFAKPFVVVGYSFTPDYDDPDTKRLLIEHGLSARSAVYGQGERTRRPEHVLEAGETRGHDWGHYEQPHAEVHEPPADPEQPRGDESGGDAEPHSDDGFAGDEPGGEEAQGRSELDEAAAFVLPAVFKKHAGETLADVYRADPRYLQWLCSDVVRPGDTKTAAQRYLAAVEGS